MSDRPPRRLTDPRPLPTAPPSPSPSLSDAPRSRPPDDESAPRRMQRLSDLLPETARQYGLEEQLDQARLAGAWEEILSERVPAAAGSCRLIGFRQDVVTVEADQPIVAQEIRLRLPELLGALRNASHVPVRQLRVTTRHV
jgi:predicted nucleic acid-binding Zn ribbon protein